MIFRTIPCSGEKLPVIGLGTWQTFNTGPEKFPSLAKVLDVMRETSATVIDSSPMYGLAEQVIGEVTGGQSWKDLFFYATKVWTTGREAGIKQMNSSFEKMKRKKMDIMHIHNLTDWKTHLDTLKRWKNEDKIRYIGITHYTDSSHEQLEQIIKSEKIDFVQFNYSVFSTHAEKSLLQTAADNGVATIINRPFGEGKAFKNVMGKKLPSFATEHGILNWSQYFIQYIISNPSVTVVIPATGDPEHAKQNFNLPDDLPDENFRKKMREYVRDLL